MEVGEREREVEREKKTNRRERARERKGKNSFARATTKELGEEKKTKNSQTYTHNTLLER